MGRHTKHRRGRPKIWYSGKIGDMMQDREEWRKWMREMS